MNELKEALEREAISRQERLVPAQPLDGIVDSFVKFYTDLKAKEQQIEETAETKDRELQQYKEQAEAATAQNKELETSLESALADKKLFREELEYALQENMLYAAKRQLDVDQLSLANRAARRDLNKAKQDKEVLGTALSFANDRLDEARRSLQEERNKAVEWVTNKVALEEDLRQRQSYAAELQSQVDRLTTGYETATKSLEAMQPKLDELEKEKKNAEKMLKEAQEENVRTEQLLAISEQKYEQIEKAYKIAMEKKTVTPRTVSVAGSTGSGITDPDVSKIRQLLANSRDENADLLSQIRNQERELAEARRNMEFLQKENQGLLSERQRDSLILSLCLSRYQACLHHMNSKAKGFQVQFGTTHNSRILPEIQIRSGNSVENSLKS